MIERYSREEITKIWDINSKFQYYLDVELAVCETYCDLGVISKDVFNDIKSKAKKESHSRRKDFLFHIKLLQKF